MILLTQLACAAGVATIPLTIEGVALTAEIADEPVERQVGLMYRDDLPAERGMLFVYPDAQPRSFWMKDTRVPLSIAYLDANGVVVHLADMTPLVTTPIPSGTPAMYALEMNQGWFAAHSVTIGSKVTGLPPASAR